MNSSLQGASIDDNPINDLSFVAPLSRFSHADIQKAGGKAANLGELLQAGFPVPDGFVVTTAAYDRFVADHALQAVIAHHLLPDSGDGRLIREAFEISEIKPDIARSIIEAYRQLGSGPVAVRSSATLEDLSQAAFAGQQDTYLNVIGIEELLAAVRRCWASLWSDRAIAYRKRQGLKSQAVSLAVVVQRLVRADIAGVLFTANPVTGERDELLIDASPGLGETVVSGLVTPDHIVVKKKWGLRRVSEWRQGRREVVIRPLPAGGTEQVAGNTEGMIHTLPRVAIRRLIRLAVAVERHFGSPQDVEWAWADGKLFLLQARPLTALPEPVPHNARPVRMMIGMLAEMLPVRPYPLDLTTWVPALSEGAVQPLFPLVGITAAPLERLLIKEDGVVLKLSGKLKVRPTLSLLVAPERLLWLSLRYNPMDWRDDPLLARAQARARDLQQANLRELSWRELLHLVHEALSLTMPLAGSIRYRYYPRALVASGALRLLLGLLGKGGWYGDLLTGAQTVTLEANRALEDLAARIHSDADLTALFTRLSEDELPRALEDVPAGRSFLAELQGFLERYGHRETALSTVLQPTWRDAPGLVLGLLKGFIQTTPRTMPARPPWQQALEALLAHPLLKIPIVRRMMLGLVPTARCLWQIREDTHFEVTRILPILRRLFLELGSRLQAVGSLQAPDDIFHLSLSELEQLDGTWPPASSLSDHLQAMVSRRKEKRAALERTPMVDPRLFRMFEASGPILLRGAAGSPGMAEGPVRIIHDISEFHQLRTGEILVAPYTNPAWTPLFQRAAAVIVDSGAAGSHAAIVAREYRLPAVVGTVTGTQTLKNGEWVQVDGYLGIVRPSNPREADRRH